MHRPVWCPAFTVNDAGLPHLQSQGLLQLRLFMSGAADERYQALPRALAGASAFQGAVSSLIYDVLMIKVGKCPNSHHFIGQNVAT